MKKVVLNIFIFLYVILAVLTTYCLLAYNKFNTVELKDKYLLSLKDFNASESLQNLVNSGVKSFKIEGRLKDINYVKNVVAYYNNELNKYASRTSSGKVFLDFEPNVDKTFNRGYTDYFLTGRTQCFNFLSPKSRGEKIGKIKRIFHNSMQRYYLFLKLPNNFQTFFIKSFIFNFLLNFSSIFYKMKPLTSTF